MQHLQVHAKSGFHVLAGTDRSEAAAMVLAGGESTGGPDNRRLGSDQWLFVIAGRGRAVVAGQEVALGKGSLLLIEAGEAHQIENSASEPLATLNFYAPPEY
ncbi:MAG: cupin domain-containing protein [Desulfuromonadales bacterium]